MKLFSALAAAFTLASSAVFAGEVSSQVLAEINLARTAPQEYAHLLAQRMPETNRDVAETVRFLQHARPLPPLASSSGLAQGAQMHVAEQGPVGGFGHGNPFSRMDHFGQWIGSAAENISYGKHDARSIVCQLIVDSGVMGKGHRKNIFSPAFGVAGAAFGSHARYGAMCVIDFAGRFVERGTTLAGL